MFLISPMSRCWRGAKLIVARMPQELRAILDALRRKQEARSGGRLDKSTHSTYKAQWRMFTQFCIKNHLPDPREGLHAEILVEFLNDKATRLSNAKSWAQWTSAIYSYATKIRLLPGLSRRATTWRGTGATASAPWGWCPR